jgi:putative ABC transport system permease protein
MSGRVREWASRVAAVFARRRLDAELDEELAAHLELATADHLQSGMPLAEARRRARIALGGVDLARERHRDARGLPWLDSIAQDVRYAARSLRRQPGFTLVALLMLALGTGANAAIFSLVSAVLLRPLPFASPDRLVLLWDDLSVRKAPSRVEPTPFDYVAWREQSQSFSDMALFLGTTFNLTGSGEPERLSGVRTTPNLFALLGIQPIVGRTLAASDDAAAVAVIDERLWRTRFGADSRVVGRAIKLDGLTHTIVGVVPADFRFPDENVSVWVPGRFTARELAADSSYSYDVLARLAPDVSLAAAQAEMNLVAERVAREHPSSRTDIGVRVTPLQEHLTNNIRPALLVLLGAVVFVLLIATANVANLLLARGANRERELAVRRALGAGRLRIFRQLLTESVVLAAAGVGLGLVVSTSAFSYLSRLVPSWMPLGTRLGLDQTVLAATAAIAVTMVLVFGTVPVLAASDVPSDGLRAAGRHTAGPRHRRARQTLVMAEIMLTVVLLAAAGLLLRSYSRLLRVDPGFRPDGLLLVQTALSPTRYATEASRTSFYERVQDRVAGLPGVVAAGYANDPPLVFKGGRALVTIEGRPEPSGEDFAQHIISERTVSPGYLDTLGLPLVRGRLFDSRDRAGSTPAVIINEQTAHRLWPDADPIGNRLKVGPRSPWYTIVGIVGDMRQMNLDQPPGPELYVPLAQPPGSAPFLWPQYLVVRTSGDPMSIAASVRRIVREIDPEQPVSNIRSMAEVFDAELANRNTQMTLVSTFAVLALIMASLGLYAVLSYTVTQQSREIGVRMALGARRATVVAAIVRSATLMAAGGLALGIGGAVGLTRVLASFLFEVEPLDPPTFAGAALVIVLVAAVAAFVPARRAASVEPASVLRTE